MNIPIKNEKEIEIMREGGVILGQMLKTLETFDQPGIDYWDFEEKFIRMCDEYNVKPACKNYAPAGYPPFPTGLCFGVNEQSVHCFPIKGKKLIDGDLVKIDTVIEYEGFFLDSAVSFGIGNLQSNKKHILEITKNALRESIAKIRPGIKLGLISNTMENIAKSSGYSVLDTYAGHGIGKSMHEEPEIPCFGKPKDGPTLWEGMVLAIEPLVCENSNVLEHHNYWETKTVDRGVFVQVEHTVLVTSSGYEILTNRQ